MNVKGLFLTTSLCVALPAVALDGTVVDANGQAIEDATVRVKGKRLETVTDADGKFTLDLNSAAELHIAASGYAHQSLDITSQALDQAQRIELATSAIEQLDVIGIPLHASNIESAMPVNVLSGDKLRRKQAATLGDTLAGEVGIHTNFHGNVASTPIIRGLSGPRVLITQNSLDVSDVSRVGPDHSVAAETVTAEQVEVLRGPATLFYGSGAIGGVVNVVDQRVPTSTETTGAWSLSNSSVNDQDSAAFNLNTGSGDLAFHLDGFYRNSNEYETPVSPELGESEGDRFVESSGEESHGFTLGTSYIMDNGYVGLSYGRQERDYGIPGHAHSEEEEEHDDDDGHAEEEEIVTLGLKQDRFQLISEMTYDSGFISAINTRISYTDYEHTEFEDGDVGTTFNNETTEIKLEAMHQSLADWNGGLVFDYKTSNFGSDGEEAFAPSSKTDTFAIALLEEKHFGDVLIQLGARIEHVDISSKDDITPDEDAEFHKEGEHEEHDEDEHHDDEDGHEDGEHEEVFFDESYTPFSISAGAVWDFKPGYNVGLSLSHSARAPSAAELLSFGPHIGTGTFEVGAIFEPHEEDEEYQFEIAEGTPGLERSNNIDLTLRKYEGDFGFIINAFYNEVDNFYAQFDTGLVADVSHGHDEDEEEEHHEDEEEHEEDADAHADELPVFLFRATDVTISGFEAQALYQVTPSIKTTLFADYVNAEINDGGYLPRIPPMRWGASVDYVKDNLSANVSFTHYDDQANTGELETETNGYHWVDASVDYQLPFKSQDLTVFFKIENATDEVARVHSSFIKDLAPKPGRNFRIGIRGSF